MTQATRHRIRWIEFGSMHCVELWLVDGVVVESSRTDWIGLSEDDVRQIVFAVDRGYDWE